MDISAHFSNLATACPGEFRVFCDGKVEFQTDIQTVEFHGRVLASGEGYEGLVSINGPEGIEQEDIQIRFEETE